MYRIDYSRGGVVDTSYLDARDYETVIDGLKCELDNGNGFDSAMICYAENLRPARQPEKLLAFALVINGVMFVNDMGRRCAQ